MTRPKIMQHVWQLGWPGESPLRHFVWGSHNRRAWGVDDSRVYLFVRCMRQIVG